MKFFIFLQHIAPQHLLSRLIGSLAASENSRLKNTFINKFIARYGVNMNEALYPDADNYSSFNDFFTRQLKPGCRAITQDNAAIACPADGKISACGDIHAGKLIQAKGKEFSLKDLLGGESERAQDFADGCFATVYLSPRDYHRVHMPFAGTLKEMVFIPGKLFSVNQTTSENIPNLFARNERVVCIFDTDIGPMAVILVGAMIVASIETVWAGEIAPSKKTLYSQKYSAHEAPEHAPVQLNKGDEMGRFKLGSTAIILFGAKAMQWSENIAENTPVQMGQTLGTVLNTAS